MLRRFALDGGTVGRCSTPRDTVILSTRVSRHRSSIVVIAAALAFLFCRDLMDSTNTYRSVVRNGWSRSGCAHVCGLPGLTVSCACVVRGTDGEGCVKLHAEYDRGSPFSLYRGAPLPPHAAAVTFDH